MKFDDKSMWEEPNDQALQQVSLSIFYKSNKALRVRMSYLKLKQMDG